MRWDGTAHGSTSSHSALVPASAVTRGRWPAGREGESRSRGVAPCRSEIVHHRSVAFPLPTLPRKMGEEEARQRSWLVAIRASFRPSREDRRQTPRGGLAGFGDLGDEDRRHLAVLSAAGRPPPDYCPPPCVVSLAPCK